MVKELHVLSFVSFVVEKLCALVPLWLVMVTRCWLLVARFWPLITDHCPLSLFVYFVVKNEGIPL